MSHALILNLPFITLHCFIRCIMLFDYCFWGSSACIIQFHLPDLLLLNIICTSIAYFYLLNILFWDSSAWVISITRFAAHVVLRCLFHVQVKVSLFFFSDFFLHFFVCNQGIDIIGLMFILFIVTAVFLLLFLYFLIFFTV